ncbi:MAG: adenosine deaminase [Bacteroidales bacterium]|nr:MAG: adenosine deaminase [Bacteroidales bacterium]
MNRERFIKDLPKVELHIHLEGAIPVIALWNLIVKYKGNKNIGNAEELAERFKYKDFPQFIETWGWKNQFLREYEDFKYIAKEVACDLKDQNIRYVEMFYTPADHFHKNIELQKLTEAVREGFNYYANEIDILLIADLCRDAGPDSGMPVVNQLSELKDTGVIGIGIGGSEHKYPPAPFKQVYERARKYGFKTTAHAGEAAGADSIWGAINELKADRIGHATRAFEDDRLVEYLGNKQIPLEMCPISNLRTGVIKDIKEHPVKAYYKKGLNVFVNTDDPKMFNNCLDDEYLILMKECGFELTDIKKLLENSINSAWCETGKKQKLINEINTYFESVLR